MPRISALLDAPRDIAPAIVAARFAPAEAAGRRDGSALRIGGRNVGQARIAERAHVAGAGRVALSAPPMEKAYPGS